MFFNSISFLIFLPVVFCLYWFVFNKSKTAQNTFLILCSYYFYSCWDWRFLFLLIFSTLLDYFSAIKIENCETQKQRKLWLWLSIGINLGFLGVFKYYDFFAVSFADMLHSFGITANPLLLKLILPVGISFYTFHGLSYIIDIYYQRIRAEKNFVDYSLFVSYFPLLVAGPIERATHLLPQVKIKRVFNLEQGKEGVRLIIFGLFKKVVVADNCGFFADQIFNNTREHSTLELWMGLFLFSFQIYGDFSGYTDIARGVSKLLGIELLKNFNYPFFSKDIADFWRRWHISLSSWFRDYVYIPLGGSKGSKLFQIRNVFAIFLLSGFWHGANWNFILWGAAHAVLFLPLLLMKSNRKNQAEDAYGLRDVPKILLTFFLVALTWTLFRPYQLSDSFEYMRRIFTFDDLTLNFFVKNAKYALLTAITVVSVVVLNVIEWNNFRKTGELFLSKKVVFMLLAMILFMGVFRNLASFIYFQF